MSGIKCRACGQAIDFVATPAGKNMPVNARPWYVVDPTNTADDQWVLTVVTEAGVVLKGAVCQVYEQEPPWMPHGMEAGREPHWVDCTQPGRFK